MPKTITRQVNYLEDVLKGKRSNATAMFFCGEYFCETIAAHPRFKELQELVWRTETSLYNRLSKKARSMRSLVLTNHVSGFFRYLDISDKKIESIQEEILGAWGKRVTFYGIDIDWSEVARSAYSAGKIQLTNQDYDKLESLQDIPRY